MGDNSIQMHVEGKFFNDPPNPGGIPGQPFFGLWEFEGILLSSCININLCRYKTVVLHQIFKQLM